MSHYERSKRVVVGARSLEIRVILYIRVSPLGRDHSSSVCILLYDAEDIGMTLRNVGAKSFSSGTPTFGPFHCGSWSTQE